MMVQWPTKPATIGTKISSNISEPQKVNVTMYKTRCTEAGEADYLELSLQNTRNLKSQRSLKNHQTNVSFPIFYIDLSDS